MLLLYPGELYRLLGASSCLKISAAVAPFVVHTSRKLLVTLFKEMSNVFTTKGFSLVKSESLPPSVDKVWVDFHFRYYRSTWKLGAIMLCLIYKKF